MIKLQIKPSRRQFINQKGFGHHLILIIVVVAIITAIGVNVLIRSRAASNPYDTVKQAQLKNDLARGMTYKGLLAIKKDADHLCKGNFEVANVRDGDDPICSHGPDPAPDGVNPSKVRVEHSLAQLQRASKRHVELDKISSAKNYDNLVGINANDAITSGVHNPVPTSAIPCMSDIKGHLVQMVLIYDSRTNHNDLSLMTNQMKIVAGRMETQVRASAIYSGPGATIRSVRFVTDAKCVPTITIIDTPISSSPAASEIISDLQKHNLNGSNRKYLTWVAHTTTWCGVGTVYNDSRLQTDNYNNTHTGYAMVGPSCWDTAAELHEMGHNLGAVQTNAPHTTGGFHCTDLHDVMCYADGKNGLAVNGRAVTVSPNCTATLLQYFLDCNHDDYFSTDPSLALSTSRNYLHNHWNMAASSWLSR